jgi:RNA polymerase sigma factor (sigma-70 family)
MESILQRVAAGDGQAIQSCIDTYGGLLWSMARRRGLPPEDAEDLVQEVFIDLWKSAGRFDPAQASEKVFVAMIARRRLIDRLRREQRRPPTQALELEDEDYPGRDFEDLENAVEASLASKALAQLNPKERNVLLLSTYHGLSHGQISEHTGLPLGTVKTYIRRGLVRVKELLDLGARNLREVGA